MRQGTVAGTTTMVGMTTDMTMITAGMTTKEMAATNP